MALGKLDNTGLKVLVVMDTLILPRILILLFAFIAYSCNKEDDSDYIIEELSIPYDGNIRDSYIMDNGKAFVIGEYDREIQKSILLRSDNEGRSWILDTFQLFGQRVEGISGFVDRLYIMVTNLDDGSKTTYSSLDFGESWDSFDTNKTSLPFFFNNEDALSSVGHKIQKTSNGGQSWDSVFYYDAMAPSYFVKAENGTVYLIGGDHFDNTNFGFIYKSDDFGNSWIDLNWSGPDIINSFFISSDIGFLFAFYGQLYKTIDGGLNFELINNTLQATSLGCHFISETEGLICTNHTILVTQDGGISWSSIYHNYNSRLINKISFKKYGLVVGENGLLIKLR